MKNLCLQRELKPPHCTSEVLFDRQPATVELAMSEVKISWRERWRKQPKTSLILSFWRVKIKKRLGRKKPLIEPSQMSELTTSLPVAGWHTGDNLHLFCPVSSQPRHWIYLAQSVEHLTAEQEVLGSIPGARPILRVLKQLRKMKVLPLPSKRRELRVAWMTT